MIGHRTFAALAAAALVAALAFIPAASGAQTSSSLAAADPSLGTPAIIPFEPAPLSGDNGPFDPFTGGSYPFQFGRW